ncbi:MAG: hypothetical protein Q7S76_00620 [bacterium]|nr:hypothetical protein [bacterium]
MPYQAQRAVGAIQINVPFSTRDLGVPMNTRGDVAHVLQKMACVTADLPDRGRNSAHIRVFDPNDQAEESVTNILHGWSPVPSPCDQCYYNRRVTGCLILNDFLAQLERRTQERLNQL